MPIDQLASPISSLTMEFSRIDLVAHWNRCGLSADYLAQFLAYNFAGQEHALIVLSTVLNELIENAVKFSLNGPHPLLLQTSFHGESVALQTRHLCRRKQAERLIHWVMKVNEEDLDDLFVEQIEYTARHNRTASGLGFITLVKDYGARLGVRIDPGPTSEYREVIVRAILRTENVEAPQ